MSPRLSIITHWPSTIFDPGSPLSAAGAGPESIDMPDRSDCGLLCRKSFLRFKRETRDHAVRRRGRFPARPPRISSTTGQRLRAPAGRRSSSRPPAASRAERKPGAGNPHERTTRPTPTRERLDILPRRAHGPCGRPLGTDRTPRRTRRTPPRDASDRARASMAAWGRHVSFFIEYRAQHVWNVSSCMQARKGGFPRVFPGSVRSATASGGGCRVPRSVVKIRSRAG